MLPLHHCHYRYVTPPFFKTYIKVSFPFIFFLDCVAKEALSRSYLPKGGISLLQNKKSSLSSKVLKIIEQTVCLNFGMSSPKFKSSTPFNFTKDWIRRHG